MRNDLENLKESYDSQETYLAKIENLTLRVHQLEEENKKLSEASSTQKKSYEKCLDEVSQKVSTALTAQKVKKLIRLKGCLLPSKKLNRHILQISRNVNEFDRNMPI